jgi:hypothetical protein
LALRHDLPSAMDNIGSYTFFTFLAWYLKFIIFYKLALDACSFIRWIIKLGAC